VQQGGDEAIVTVARLVHLAIAALDPHRGLLISGCVTNLERA
jgi:hypothetical protein